MDFEFPLAGGDLLRGASPSAKEEAGGNRPTAAGGNRLGAAPSIALADVGRLLGQHLPADDPLPNSYADRLSGGALGAQSLKGYLTGSVDAVLRIDGRYLVVDYKTNWLGEPEHPLTTASATDVTFPSGRPAAAASVSALSRASAIAAGAPCGTALPGRPRTGPGPFTWFAPASTAASRSAPARPTSVRR